MSDRTVLVVEDFDDTRTFIRMLLEKKGCNVLEAGAVNCFSKPIEFGLLDEILGRYAA